jgi:hypothetical protein
MTPPMVSTLTELVNTGRRTDPTALRVLDVHVR